MTQSIATIDIRDAFFDELYEIAKRDKNVLFLTADTGAWSLKRFRKDLPDQFINVGISEQNLVSVAAGLALGGKRVFIYAIAPFITQRCYEQIKVDLCVMNLPVTIIGSGPGLTYSSDGPTHHAIEDISIMSALPTMTILNPCDQVSAQAAARLAYENNGPVYIRIDKGVQPVLYSSNTNFSKGISQLKKGKDLLIITTGIMTQKAFQLADRLKEQTINAGIIDIFRIKPINKTMLVDAVKKVRPIVTLEEHNHIGGIGSAISILLSEEGILIPIKHFAINDEYCKFYGDREWMQQHLGLDVSTVCKEVEEWFGKLKVKVPRDDSSEYPYELTVKKFADIFGTHEDQIPPKCKKIIAKTNFRYRIAENREREKLLFRATKVLFENLPASGKHRKHDWEKGWRENLENFIKSNYDPKELIPKFVKNKEHIRFDGEYIFPANPTFETSFVRVLRSYLFGRYFHQFQTIYEFGCGTGHNLLQLAKLYPDKQLYGLDWTDSSCEIVNKIAEIKHLNLKAIHFDMFSPDYNLPIGPDCAVYTIGAMEQLGINFDPFLEFLIDKKIGLCVNIETLYELYDQDKFFDYIAAKYLEKRGYLKGYLKRLQQLEKKGKIQILAIQKTLSGGFHDGYNYIIWKPVI